jgi:hypothetical protein
MPCSVEYARVAPRPAAILAARGLEARDACCRECPRLGYRTVQTLVSLPGHGRMALDDRLGHLPVPACSAVKVQVAGMHATIPV